MDVASISRREPVQSGEWAVFGLGSSIVVFLLCMAVGIIAHFGTDNGAACMVAEYLVAVALGGKSLLIYVRVQLIRQIWASRTK
jgi:hypothetical protein